ncbi:hypothetical protein SAMN05421751_13612 [Jhaorihella thermophila]|uniref:Sulfate permease, SulP family n=1 Tax=Jhaorihella thermophila TaxID=488547 RepID=A0A1H5ZF97_9RHOB|nr:hypothetical protein SAMN05421751_13612 [Jhaorihella thermophila]
MSRTLTACISDRLAIPDLRWVPDTRLSPALMRVELLSGLTLALALVPEAMAFPSSPGSTRWWGFARPDSWGRSRRFRATGPAQPRVRPGRWRWRWCRW